MQYYMHMAKINTTSSGDDAAHFYTGEQYTIETSLGYLLKQAQLAFTRTVDSKMADMDLTAMQWGPLLLIAHRKAETAAELSRIYGVETSTMTRMLDRLECKGLLTRHRCAEDRRVIKLELTPAGAEVAAKVPYRIADSLNYHLQGFSKSEFETLKSLLQRFTK